MDSEREQKIMKRLEDKVKEIEKDYKDCKIITIVSGIICPFTLIGTIPMLLKSKKRYEELKSIDVLSGLAKSIIDGVDRENN